jgi:hypothetical protein
MKLLDEFREPQVIPRPPRKYAAVLIQSATIESWKYAVDTRTPELVPGPANEAATLASCNRSESDFWHHSVSDPSFAS